MATADPRAEPGPAGSGTAPAEPGPAGHPPGYPAARAERYRFRVTGTVQGVGFRPFVYRTAVSLGLTGFVRNDSDGVLVEVQGDPAALSALRTALTDGPPPLARVTGVLSTTIPPVADDTRFRIVDSRAEGPPAVAVSVDTAPCDDCLAEVDDPEDRRYRYPFTNCTNCGPRYTIVQSVPYDRPATTMAPFAMCRDCQREYDDPGDRRFHAQPNACPACGPTLRWCAPGGSVLTTGGGALAAAVAAIRAGAVIAVKGVGGFHLATDANRAASVAELRRRKARDDKPFAVMVADLDGARALVDIDGPAEGLLASPARPIVLAPRRHGAPVADQVAPGLPELGLVLPYSPLHHLLLAGAGVPLVMTSGNLSDDPIAHTDEDAFERLGPLVDGVLTHGRGIHIRCDDSVVRASPARLQVLRRSRGYAPEPLPLPGTGVRQVLALGAELKSTVAVAKNGWVVVSHHIGDLEHLATYRSFLQAVDHLCHLAGVTPEVVAHDLHPEYLSTKLALDLELPGRPVQHHHAHIAACLAEHGETGPVLGVAFDGLGMGDDGVLWGGEFLLADLSGYRRVGHLRAAPLPGGAAAVREPWRMAVTWAQLAAGRASAVRHGERLDPRAGAVADLVGRAAEGANAVPATTSAGRLFDAVAALLGIRARVTYEGQAAIELEALAGTVGAPEAPCYPVGVTSDGGTTILDPAPLIAAVLSEIERGTPAPVIAAGFHRGLAEGTAALATTLAAQAGVGTVALSGGVFQNVRFSDLVETGLRRAGLAVLLHRRIPPNDGGVSVGQAAVAATAPAGGAKDTH